MNNSEVYEINLLELWGKCLLHWKRIAVIAIVVAFAALGLTYLTFEAPPEDCAEYRTIEASIINRGLAEENLAEAQKRFEENQYYTMSAETIQSKRLTITVELDDKSQITDQMDPTDTVLFAYHNMARTQFYQEMVPAVVTDLQWRQLISIGYDSGLNAITVSMTSDDEALIDTVMAAAAQWYGEQQSIVVGQTYPHDITVLPVAVTTYDRATAESMVSSEGAEANLRALEESIYASNATLGELLKLEKENEAMSMTEAELTELFNRKKEMEKEPGKMMPLLIGGILGGVLMLCWYCLPVIAKGKLLGETAVAGMTGWRLIGRVKALKKTKDPLVKWGRSLLYRNHKEGEAALRKETAELAVILMKDRGLSAGGKLGLVGDIPEEEMDAVAQCLAGSGLTVEASLLCTDRIGANQLCRAADVIVFVGRSGAVTTREIDALQEILRPLDKTPLGYVLV